VFVEAAGAWAAVSVADGGYSWDDPEDRSKGIWLRCENDLSPIILEVSDKSEYVDSGSFRSAVIGRSSTLEAESLQYESLSGDMFTFYADYSSPPEINGKAINYAPPKVYDSPFVQSQWDSAVVTISFGGSTRVLDFNE
jgi:hypothetical protein